MILKFPRPYPDENFYSWIARYHERSANYYAKTTVETVFNATHGCAIYGLPTGLMIFCSQLQPLIQYNPEQILQFHTSLPYYSSSFPKQRIKAAKAKMLGDFNAGTHAMLGMLATVVSDFRYLRYCSDCLNQDIQSFGEPYWHRVHQLPGVLLCPTHHKPVLNSQIDKQNIHAQLFANAGEHAKPNLIQKHIEPCHRLISVAEESAKLLSHFRRPVSSTHYRSKLIKAGFNKGSLIDQNKLAEAFSEFWPEAVLKSLGVPDDLKSQHSWLRFMTRRTRQGLQAHPLQHILLRLFLKDQKPLTKASLPLQEPRTFSCPNPFCTELDDSSAKLVRTHQYKESGPTYGVISCNCGFSFSCDINTSDLYKGNVITYGDVWDKQFIEYVQQGHSIHKLEQLMSVSRPVIKRKALELNLKPSWLSRARPKKAKMSVVEKRAIEHKKIYNRYRKKHPSYSLKELRTKISATIKFLYRYEREWLDQNRPPPKKTMMPERIDWKKRDQEYLEQVQSIVSELNSIPGKPQKITPFRISKILGQKNIFTKIPDKIPATMTYLTQACNKDNYITRTFTWAAERLRQKGQVLTRNNILRKAAIRYTPTDLHEAQLRELSSSYESSYKPFKNSPG